jgi:hypothetical protein
MRLERYWRSRPRRLTEYRAGASIQERRHRKAPITLSQADRNDKIVSNDKGSSGAASGLSLKAVAKLRRKDNTIHEALRLRVYSLLAFTLERRGRYGLTRLMKISLLKLYQAFVDFVMYGYGFHGILALLRFCYSWFRKG